VTADTEGGHHGADEEHQEADEEEDDIGTEDRTATPQAQKKTTTQSTLPRPRMDDPKERSFVESFG
jgi:hypothetical protein